MRNYNCLIIWQKNRLNCSCELHAHFIIKAVIATIQTLSLAIAIANRHCLSQLEPAGDRLPLCSGQQVMPCRKRQHMEAAMPETTSAAQKRCPKARGRTAFAVLLPLKVIYFPCGKSSAAK